MLRVRCLRASERLQVAEGNRVDEDADAIALAQLRLQTVQRGPLPLRGECVEIESEEARSEGANSLERRLDGRHGTATIPMDDRDAHPMPRELLRGGEAEAARSAQDQRPLRSLETQAHAQSPLDAPGGSDRDNVAADGAEEAPERSVRADLVDRRGDAGEGPHVRNPVYGAARLSDQCIDERRERRAVERAG